MVSDIAKNELVSIVIPTYNRTSFLKNAIDSAINQAYKNIEVIVVDDSSTNDTEELCLSYGNKIRYFRRRHKGGIASAFNFAIKQMRGVWFKELTDDNILARDCVEVLVNYAHMTGARILYSDYELIDVDGNQLGARIQQDFTDYYEFVAKLWTQQIVNTDTSLIHRSCFEIVGEFSTSYDYAFDYEWCLRACLVNGYMFFHVPKLLLKFRLHTQQASWLNYGDTHMVNMHLRLLEKIREKIQKQIIEVNPEKLELFRLYQKQYPNPLRQGFLADYKTIVKRTYKHLPYNVRNYGRRLWYKRIRSFREIRCEVCKKIYAKQSFFYLRPNTTFITCQNCGTYYESENLRRLIKNQVSPID